MPRFLISFLVLFSRIVCFCVCEFVCVCELLYFFVKQHHRQPFQTTTPSLLSHIIIIIITRGRLYQPFFIVALTSGICCCCCLLLFLSLIFSVSFRYCLRSAILVRTMFCFLAKRFSSGNLIISVGFSSETISHNKPQGLRPANFDKSIAASVCPSRSKTPPGFARSGKTCPGRQKSASVQRGSDSKLMVNERSLADIPVVNPSWIADDASTVTPNAVPFGSSLLLTIEGIPSSSSRFPSIATQTTPLEYRTIFAISIGVQASAAMIKSPSFSRSMSSTTTTISPFDIALIASSTDCLPKQ